MKVKIARQAGFCMGVDLALKKLDLALEESKSKSIKVATIGPIIHNPQVLKEYEEKEVQVFNTLEEIFSFNKDKELCVIIRAHGIPKEDEEAIKAHNITIVDATCPKVKAAQLAVYKATLKAKEQNSQSLLLLYGEEEHPEVKGLLSYSALPYIVFSEPKEILERIDTFPKNFILASQTTQDMEIYNIFSNKLKVITEKNQGSLHILNTICNATRERQEAVRELAQNADKDSVDAFIVVGGKTSGNTRRLAEIAQSYDLPTYHIETASELNFENFKNMNTVALTAGASTPNKFIEEVKNYFENLSQKEE